MNTDPPKPLDYATAGRRRSPWRIAAMIVVAVVVLAGIGYGYFALLSYGKSD